MKFPGKRLIVEYKNRRARKNVKSLWGDINIKEIARAVEDDTAAASDTQTHTPQGRAQEKPVAKAADAVAAPAMAGGRILAAMPPAPAIDRAPPPRQAQKTDSEFAVPSKHDGAAKPTPKEGADNSPGIASVADTTIAAKPTPQPKPASGQSDLSDKAPTPVPVAAGSDVSVAPLAVRQPVSVDQAFAAKSEPDRLPKKVRNDKPRAVQHARGQAPRQPLVGFYQLPADFNEDLAKLEKENHDLKQLLIKQLQAENRRLAQMILRASSPIETEWNGQR
ncbi:MULTISPECIES: hypothetical protein [Ochrobactrum]|uniref:hypothetical protein n=1 Tax=Ochrobactrum TaxID=528 RepID=UPI002989CCC9|nr:hypothetical protein [Ochrobactrum sp. AN78]MDH7793648.1 hypothetical protein [Ochrobactrum sp. AN78]